MERTERAEEPMTAGQRALERLRQRLALDGPVRPIDELEEDLRRLRALWRAVR